MTIQRAILKGTIANLVQIRSMYTADVVESGGDTFPILWDAYLHGVYDSILGNLTSSFITSTVEIQDRVAGTWVTSDEVVFSASGSNSTALVPNAVAAVLIGKAAGLRGMGRKFISGLVINTIDGNVVNPAIIAGFVTALAGYVLPFTGIGGGTITPGVVDKTGTFRAFVGGFISSYLGSMRRRKPGNGM